MMPDFALPLFFSLLIPFAIAGLLLINAGLNRSRSAAHSAVSGLCAAAVSVLSFIIFGCAIAGIGARPSGSSWDWFGHGGLFARNVTVTAPHTSLLMIFQLFAVCVAVQIPVAGGAERWRLRAACVTTALFAGVLFPLTNHWIWGGGFLSQLGAHFNLGAGVIDAGGAGVIHLTGGLSALALAWILGARQGKFSADGMPAAMPGHNAVIVVIGSLLALLGWTGLAAGGALLVYHSEPGYAFLAVINTLVAASGGALAAMITTGIRFGKPDASLTANGWVCGLVSVSAGAPFFKIPEAMLVGLAAGLMVVFAIEIVELRMHVDDPTGAISVHAAGGIWGLLAAGIFEGNAGQFLAQFIAVGTIAGFVLPFAYVANTLLNKVVPHRADAVGERQGMDLHELGTGAYPDFVTHREDFPRR